MVMRHLSWGICGFALLTLASCSSPPVVKKEEKRVEVKSKKEVFKKKRKPEEKVLQTYRGLASWYSIKTNRGRKTASGRLLTNSGRTTAHKTLPFGTRVRVTSLFNGKSEIVSITDRGPYVKGRVIDVTIGCAQRLGFYSRGITKVKVEVLSRGTWKYRKP